MGAQKHPNHPRVIQILCSCCGGGLYEIDYKEYQQDKKEYDELECSDCNKFKKQTYKSKNMAGTNTGGGANRKFYNLKTKATKELAPHFLMQEKVDGAWKGTQTFTGMQGMLNKAEIVEKEYQNIKRNIFVLTIDDGSETSVISMEHGGVAYSFFNSLAKDCNKLDTYSFEVWKKESGGKYYANGGVKRKVGNEFVKIDWSVDPKATPQAEPVMVNGTHFENNGQKMYDSRKQKAFWEELFLTKIVAIVSPVSNNTTVSSGTVSAGSGAPVMNSASPDNDDLPF